MEDRVRLLDDPEKAGVTFVETVEKNEGHLTPLVTSVPSTPELKPSSISSPSPSRANNVTFATDHPEHIPAAPRDKGWGAWRVLCGAILVQGILFGKSCLATEVLFAYD